ncbi:hypothetical protein [Mycoplasma suis]|uniref:Uncharacterized protein n=1 Tax=Mycoplasma suis (strain Illinois) TaxID=768700 RepID=F0QSA4_MYCSL|nr:hypothetical protein [Mycoplasma suis]ADX98374.1 hypothetical protein MSU_0862 [Mycoplasma suis str. Illinois]
MMLSFLDATKHSATVFCAFGATCLFVVSYLHWKGINDSKDTSGLINKFLIFSCVTASLFIIGTILDFCGGDVSEGVKWSMLVGNFCSFTANYLVYKIKQSNIKKAEEAGLSEKEYCLQLASSVPTDQQIEVEEF